MAANPSLKPVISVGSSRRDLRSFPEPVQDHTGFALDVARRGVRHRDTKTLSGFGGTGVVKVVEDFRADTFPPVYTVPYGSGVRPSRFPEEIEGRTGDAAPGIELLRQRLREAEPIAKGREL
jgi:hypothetical protein